MFSEIFKVSSVRLSILLQGFYMQLQRLQLWVLNGRRTHMVSHTWMKEHKGGFLQLAGSRVTSLSVISQRRKGCYHSLSCNPALAFDPAAACTAANAAPPEVHRIWKGGMDFTTETVCFCNLFPHPNLYRFSHRRQSPPENHRRLTTPVRSGGFYGSSNSTSAPDLAPPRRKPCSDYHLSDPRRT